MVGRRTAGTTPDGIPRKKRRSGASTPRRRGSAEYYGSPSSLLRAGAKSTATTAQLVLNPLIRVVKSGCRREAVDQSGRENRRAPAG